MKQPCVYIVTNKPDGVLYIGVTSDVARRAWEHRTGVCEGFTSKFWLQRLVYFEFHDTMEGAILREKQMKKWNRAWKIEQIEKHNPDWRDLYDDLQKKQESRLPLSRERRIVIVVMPAKAGIYLG